ncbi:MAG: polyprenyl diphosphate synthase [bacterium]|nr:polyprenyl diphosphate synthase [bacterium]
MHTDSKIPECIGIILDGNRRWAKERGLPLLEGHRQGAERLHETMYWVRDRGIKHLVVYAFSTENWNRSEAEVLYLLKLFQIWIDRLFAKLSKENIRIRFIGERGRFDTEMQKAMARIEEMGVKNDALMLWVCLSYGGRSEIAAAANAAATEGKITEETLTRHLWTLGMPNPAIIIRTGGEKRLSGFLTWQSIYSELFFVDAYWPDFSEVILDSILNEYKNRERRMGK